MHTRLMRACDSLWESWVDISNGVTPFGQGDLLSQDLNAEWFTEEEMNAMQAVMDRRIKERFGVGVTFVIRRVNDIVEGMTIEPDGTIRTAVLTDEQLLEWEKK